MAKQTLGLQNDFATNIFPGTHSGHGTDGFVQIRFRNMERRSITGRTPVFTQPRLQKLPEAKHDIDIAPRLRPQAGSLPHRLHHNGGDRTGQTAHHLPRTLIAGLRVPVGQKREERSEFVPLPDIHPQGHRRQGVFVDNTPVGTADQQGIHPEQRGRQVFRLQERVRLPGQDAHHIAPGKLILLKIDTHGTRTAINHAEEVVIVPVGILDRLTGQRGDCLPQENPAVGELGRPMHR